MVPDIYYQLLTVFAPCGAAAFPVMYAPKTCALYRQVCSDVGSRLRVCLWARNDRLWAASIAAFQEVFDSIIVSGCWFHHFQAVLKCVNKLSLIEDYRNLDDIKGIIRCMGLLLLSHPWTVAAHYAEPSYVWCCVFTHDCVELLHWVNSDVFVNARIRIRRTD